MLQNMIEGAPLKLIIPFMVPLLIGNVFQQLYNIADIIIIVGRTIGVNALAAVGAVSPLFMLTMVLTRLVSATALPLLRVSATVRRICRECAAALLPALC